jgi:hypothetical protein
MPSVMGGTPEWDKPGEEVCLDCGYRDNWLLFTEPGSKAHNMGLLIKMIEA